MTLSRGGGGGDVSQTERFAPASRGGERRVRLAVALARRTVGVASRWRLRELQLLAVPCCVALLAAWLPPAGGAAAGSAAGVAIALGFCLLALAGNAALTVLAPWADQHLWPVAALLLALRLALGVGMGGGSPTGGGAAVGAEGGLAHLAQVLGLPGVAAVIALYAVLAARGVRVAMLQARRRAHVAAATTCALALQAALALAAHLALLPGGAPLLPLLREVPAPFLGGDWPTLLLDGALLLALLGLSSAARGARPAPLLLGAGGGADAGATGGTGGTGGAGDAARVRRLQRLGDALLGVFAALLVAAAWRAVST